MKRLHIGNFKRFMEIGRMFGWFDRDTWKTLFPPFAGWDVGCGYCALEAESQRLGRCERHDKMGEWSKCGTLDHDSATAEATGAHASE